MEMNG
jgi:hypothetical protein